MATAPTAPTPNFMQQWQQVASTLPQNLPDEAYEALSEKFYYDKVAPHMIDQGLPIETQRQEWMKQTARPKASFPRTQVFAQHALSAFEAPLVGMGAEPGIAKPEEADIEAQRQGISPAPYAMAGELAGQAPYWAAGMGLAGSVAEGAGSAEAMSRVVKTMAAASIQGAYDAAKAPDGERAIAGIKGALTGGAVGGAFEFTGPMWRSIMGSHGVSETTAKAIEAVAKGSEDPESMAAASDAYVADPSIADTVTAVKQQQEAAARSAGVPQTIEEATPGKLTVSLTGADGKPYRLRGEDGKFLASQTLYDHLQAGGKLDVVSGDPAKVAQFYKALEEKGIDKLGVTWRGTDLENDTVRQARDIGRRGILKGILGAIAQGAVPSTEAESAAGGLESQAARDAMSSAYFKGMTKGSSGTVEGAITRDMLNRGMNQAASTSRSQVLDVLNEAIEALGFAPNSIVGIDSANRGVWLNTALGRVFRTSDVLGDMLSAGEDKIEYGITRMMGRLGQLTPNVQQAVLDEFQKFPVFDLAMEAHDVVSNDWRLRPGELADIKAGIAKYVPDAPQMIKDLDVKRLDDIFEDIPQGMTIREAAKDPDFLEQQHSLYEESQAEAVQRERQELSEQVEQIQRPTGMELQRTHLGLGETGEGGQLMRYAVNLGKVPPTDLDPTMSKFVVDPNEDIHTVDDHEQWFRDAGFKGDRRNVMSKAFNEGYVRVADDYVEGRSDSPGWENAVNTAKQWAYLNDRNLIHVRDLATKREVSVPIKMTSDYLQAPDTWKMPPGGFRFQGIVRGSSDVPLNEQGYADVEEAASKLHGLGPVYNADLMRHRQTATTIVDNVPTTYHAGEDPRFRSWALGALEGMPHEDAKDAIDSLIDTPDVAMPGRGPLSTQAGESLNQYRDRVLPALAELWHKAWSEESSVGVVTSSRDIGLLKAWIAKNMEGLDIDPEVFRRSQENPGSVYYWDLEGDLHEHTGPDATKPGVYLIRHGRTDWNAEPAEPDKPLIRSKDTPAYYRRVGSLPEFDFKGATLPGGKGGKSTVIFNPQNIDNARDTVFHENLHANFNYTGIDNLLPYLTTKHEPYEGMVKDIFSGAFDADSRTMYLRNPRFIPEEVYTYAATAVRIGDEATIRQFADADTDKETFLRWVTNTSQDILEHTAQASDSIHARSLERRMNSVIARATSRQADIARMFDNAAGSIEYDPTSHTWNYYDHTTDRLERFGSRDDLVDYLEDNYAKPLLAPELVDQSLLPEGLPRYALKTEAPNNAKAPIQTDPPPPELTKPVREGPKPGMSVLSFFFRPFNDWLSSTAKKMDMPELYSTFSRIDDQMIEYNNGIRPYVQTLQDTLLHHSDERQTDFFKWVQAADPAERARVEKTLSFTPEELEHLQDYKDNFLTPLEQGHPPLTDYAQRIVPMARNNGWDVDKMFPKGRGQHGFFADMMLTGQLDPRDTNLLRVSAAYLRRAMQQDHLDNALDDALSFINEKDANGNYKVSLLRPLLSRHLDYVRGVPDWTQKAVTATIQNAIDIISNGINKVNEYLPASMQLPTIEEGPRDALSKYILFSYAGELALRPMVPIRDALQLFITTLPIIGPKYLFQGMREAFPEALREGREGNWFQTAQKYGAFIERNDLSQLYAGGGPDSTSLGGKFTHAVENAMNVIRLAHNSNRLVAFVGHTLQIEDALDSANAQAFIKRSGAWFMPEGMRNQYVKEWQLLGPSSDRADFARRMASDMVDQTQWNFRRGAMPGIYKYQLGRLFGQYGTWPMNYIEYARRIVTGSDKAEVAKALSLLTLAHGAILSAGQSMGVDTAHWVFTQPMAYGGGPLFQAVTNIPNTFDFETYKGDDSRRELRRMFFPGMIPGGEALSEWYDAIANNDEHALIRLMGFKPMNEKEYSRGYHQFVP